MKNRLILYFLTVLILFLCACEEIEKGPLFSDSKTPQPIISPVVVNEPGGATIFYNLPGETDLLYVKAIYSLNNKQYEARSSIYLNSIKIEGYGDTQEHSVYIHTVDRSENISEPVVVTIKPEIPDVHMVRESIEMVPDFGGVQFTWKNLNNAPLAFLILSTDSTGTMNISEIVYSSMVNGQYTIRGFDPVENIFGIIVRDRWDNFSDSLIMKLTPMYEEKLNKKEFNRIVLPGDADLDAWGQRYIWMFDDNLKTMSHTYAGTGWPQYFTIDLGVTAKLSRFILHQRLDNTSFAYGHGNPRLFEVWFANDEPPSDGSWEGWTKTGDFVASRPTEEGGTAEEDLKHLVDGDEFSFKLDDPPVRYIRILVNETWGLTGFIHIGELTFYGQIIL